MIPFFSSLLRIGAAVSLVAAAHCAADASAVLDSADGVAVVHDAGGTVAAAPYLERPALSDDVRERALDRARARLGGALSFEAPAFSPVIPEPLFAGPASRVRIRGLARPVFAVGGDRTSLVWLAANAAWLRKRGAQGFLVDAPSEESFSLARAFAARLGLRLEPVSGAALADAYGARSYPFVAEPPP